MTDRAYIVSRTLENKIAIAENNDQNTLLVTLDVLKEILAILKEQDDMGKELTDAMELVRKKNERIEKLLKAQEAVEAKTEHWIYKKCDDMFMCSSCEKYSIRNDYPYCHWCGAKMKQEGR